VLEALASARGNTIPKLARDMRVNQRTIRRDLVALQDAGLPVYDEELNGTKCWKVDPTALGWLARSGLAFNELCALYSGRALVASFAGQHALADLDSALDKIRKVLPPALRDRLDRLPQAVVAKPPQGKGASNSDVMGVLFDAILDRRVVAMRYHSFESRTEKSYVIHPYRLSHALGNVYLEAFVPAYGEMRTFAVDRIRRAGLDKGTFTRAEELSSTPFNTSMGVHRGPTCKVQLRFDADVAPLVRDRTYHASQQLKDRSDGSVTMTLQVSDDIALRNWILSFGRRVRVVSPASLAEWVRAEFVAASEQYPSDGRLRLDDSAQPPLPFLVGRME
jgi:proteasome accessory factor B